MLNSTINNTLEGTPVNFSNRNPDNTYKFNQYKSSRNEKSTAVQSTRFSSQGETVF